MTGEHTEREIEYCGGEMDGWSDPVPADDLRVRYVSELLPEGPGSALLVGARAAKLANHLLRQGFSVTLLVRGESDARSASGSGADVVCGSFEAWTPPVGFDLVIALDSVDDILPPLSDGVGALEFIEVLRRLGSSYVAYLDNGASPAALDRQARAPQENHQFSAFGTGYDLRSPVFAELSERASAAVFDRAVVGSVAIDRAQARTLLRSLCSDDLRFDALLATPMLAANGWLVGTLGDGDAVAYRGLGGVVATGLPGADGTPVEFRVRQLLVRDLQRVSAGLRAYARWADGRPAPLLRNVIAGRSGFEVIDPPQSRTPTFRRRWSIWPACSSAVPAFTRSVPSAPATRSPSNCYAWRRTRATPRPRSRLPRRPTRPWHSLAVYPKPTPRQRS